MPRFEPKPFRLRVQRVIHSTESIVIMFCYENADNLTEFEYYQQFKYEKTVVFRRFWEFYFIFRDIHGYLAVAVCVVGKTHTPTHPPTHTHTHTHFTGLLVNTLYIYVLCLPSMRSTINGMLVAMACCDTVVMTSYLIYVVHLNLMRFDCYTQRYTYVWACLTISHSILSVTLRAMSLWTAGLLGMVHWNLVLWTPLHSEHP